MLGDHVHLEVDPVAGLPAAERGAGEGLGDQAHREAVVPGLHDGEADAVDRDRPLVHQVAGQVGGQAHLDDLPVLAGSTADDGADSVHVALDDVAAEPGLRGHRTLEVDPVAGLDTAQARLVERLLHDVGGPRVAVALGDGQAAAVDGDRVAEPGVGQHVLGVDGQPEGVALVLDPGHGAELLDDPGEHQLSLFRGVSMSRTSVWPSPASGSTVTSVTSSLSAPAIVVIPRSPDGRGAGTEQQGGDVDDDLVDQAGVQEGGGQGRAALQEHVLPVAGEQVGERLARVAGAQLQRLDGQAGRRREDPVGRIEVALPHHHAERLLREVVVVVVADGQPRVVDGDRVGADQHHVAQGPQPVGVPPARQPRDPAAGAVGGGATAVQRRRELPGHEGAVVLDCERPDPVERPGLLATEALDDLDTGLTKALRSPGGDRVRVALGEHHAPYAGRDQRLAARARASGVVAGLEGDHGGGTTGGLARLVEGVALGVGRARAPVVALRDGPAVVGQQDAADARVRAQRDAGGDGQLEGARHRGLLGCCRVHPRRLSCPLTDSGATARSRPTVERWTSRTTPACASHPDFDRRSRIPTWSTVHWR